MDSERDQRWELLEMQVASLIGKGEYGTVVNVLNQFLATKPLAAEASEALALRAYAKEDLGEFSGALTDLLQAHRLSDVGTYRRYTLELTIGALFKTTGDPQSSLAWYRRALETVIVAKEDISGGSALRSFLELKGKDDVSSEERALCHSVARASWGALHQRGEPDLTNLQDLATTLIELGSRKT
jgi:tetratricopeptide (TPR) repeat protein